MSNYTIEYSTDNQQTWTLVSGSYSGSVAVSDMNKFLPDLNITKAYFRTYISGSTPGGVGSETSTYLIGGTNLQFSSYYTIKEHKYMCVVNRGEFTYTQNPTAFNISGSIPDSIIQLDNDGNSITFRRDEHFHTFATSIGLYDNSLKLVAYAKFANPIKIQKDLDSVFIVKFDY